jgi:hypothetical protein
VPPRKAAQKEEGTIEVQRVGKSMAHVRIRGTAPLILNKFSEKARRMMLDAQQGQKKIKETRNPEQDFKAASHRLTDGRYGFPAPGLKGSIVDAARYFNNNKLTMELLKRAIFVHGEGSDMLVPLEGKEPGSIIAEPYMREDTVRNATGVADFRFRPSWDEWALTFEVVFVPNLLSFETVLALVDAAGIGGIGEWRPSSKMSKTGTFGTFELDDDYEMKEIKL